VVTSETFESWRSGLEDLFACFAGRFARVEPRRYAFAYVPRPSQLTSTRLFQRTLEVTALAGGGTGDGVRRALVDRHR
jgi:hypothetical protein